MAGLLVPLTLCLAGVYITLISLSVVYHFPPNAMLGGTNEAGLVLPLSLSLLSLLMLTQLGPSVTNTRKWSTKDSTLALLPISLAYSLATS